MYSRDKKEENVKTQNDEPEVEVSLLHSNRIQFLEGDWQVEYLSQLLKKSNDFEDEKQRKMNELLSQLHCKIQIWQNWKPSTTLSRFMKYVWNFSGSF